jgi:tryptophanyl-tRNA synthetase
MSWNMSKPVILTGLRANNDLHLGNYLGALRPIVNMAKERADTYQVNLFVPDLHSFTTSIDHGTLQDAVTQNLKLFVAAGLPLDNPHVHIYRQSYISAHSELTWILDCFTGIGEMGRMTQFKDRAAKLGEDRISVGLFNYPVLMAADILLYGAKYIPVGDDQTQHVEFTRDIAERLNKQFGDLFVVPEPVEKQHEFFGKDEGLRVKDMADPTKKMSKSDDSGRGVIFLTDDPDVARKKIMSATTDSLQSITYDPVNQPGVANLLDILKFLVHTPSSYHIDNSKPTNSYAELKTAVADTVESLLTDFQKRLAEVNEQAILDKLAVSEKEMNEQANATLQKVQKAVGLRA